MPTPTPNNRPQNDPASTSSGPRRRGKRQRKSPLPSYLLPVSALIFLVALLALALTRCGGEAPPAAVTPTPTPSLVGTSTPTPPAVATPTPTPVPSLTPPPIPVVEPYDFAQPVPQGDAVGDDYFTDAVFIGDSRTDGLRLFGGIPDTNFLVSTGITVFEVGNAKKGVRIDGEKVSILDALALEQYKKVYIMLGVNELGYFNDSGFEKEYAGFVDKVRALQPDAILYLQNLPAINPDKAKANNQPYYITNEQIAVYNGIIARIAADKKAVLVDVNEGLTDENGLLLRENTTDGVHFSKDHYKRWYEYLKIHTVDADAYWAAQS